MHRHKSFPTYSCSRAVSPRPGRKPPPIILKWAGGWWAGTTRSGRSLCPKSSASWTVRSCTTRIESWPQQPSGKAAATAKSAQRCCRRRHSRRRRGKRLPAGWTRLRPPQTAGWCRCRPRMTPPFWLPIGVRYCTSCRSSGILSPGKLKSDWTGCPGATVLLRTYQYSFSTSGQPHQGYSNILNLLTLQ